MLPEEQRKRVFRTIILTQCLGVLPAALFQNGFYLNYFSKLGVSSSAIATLFALPPLLGFFLMLPSALYCDRFGKKKLAVVGQVLLVAGLAIIMAAGGMERRAALRAIAVSLLVSCVGGSLQAASWLALLNPIVPQALRGRFFGRLRMTFQIVAILFSLAVVRAFRANESMAVFLAVLGLVLAATVLRIFTYARIPEIANGREGEGRGKTFVEAFRVAVAVPGYVHFNGYVFLVTLFSAAVPVVFGLMQKDVFGFSPSQITLMGSLFLAGAVAGCWLGGRLVDRAGTRAVFLAAHLSYALAMLAMLARHWAPWPLPVHAGACSLFFSLVAAMAGVAVTSEMMALIPATNPSFSTSFTMALANGAAALSGLFVARAIGWGILAAEWRVRGVAFSAYDSLLLVFAAMILLMLAAIGLVPRIVKTVQLMPGNGYPRL